MRSRLTLLATGLVVGIALTLGAGWANGYRTHIPSDDGYSASVVVPTAVPAKSYTYAVTRVCKEGPAGVTITGVRIAKSYHDIEIVDFSVAPSLAMGHYEKADLESYLEHVVAPSTGPRTATLATRCSPEHDDTRDVVVEMRVPSAEELPAAAIRFVIDYKVRGVSKSITTETGITFCSGDDSDKQIEELLAKNENDPIATCDLLVDD